VQTALEEEYSAHPNSPKPAMTDAQLAFYSGWASIIGFFVSVISLLYLRRIKTNIVRFRRKQRIRQLMEEVFQIPPDARPITTSSRTKLLALKRNIPTFVWSRMTRKGRATLEVHRSIDAGDIASLQEALQDWSTYSEEP
jgi:hypothetical protein